MYLTITYIFMFEKEIQSIEITFVLQGSRLCAGTKCASSTRRLAELQKKFGAHQTRAEYITTHTQLVSKNAKHWQVW